MYYTKIGGKMTETKSAILKSPPNVPYEKRKVSRVHNVKIQCWHDGPIMIEVLLFVVVCFLK